MMIEITESKHGFLCQICHGKEDIKEINFHADGTGIIVRLCKSCRGELLGLLMSEVVRSIKDIGEYRIDGNKYKAHSVPIADGFCFVAEMCDIMHDTLKHGGVEQAKRMHWGTYCRSYEMCHASGLCEVVCPDGGVGAREGEHG